MELQRLSLNFMLMYLLFCNTRKPSIADKLHFNKFSPTLTFSPNPQGKSRFTFGERKQVTWYTLTLLCNAQTGLMVSTVAQSSSSREVSPRACLATEAFPMPRSRWHEHCSVAAPWGPEHKICWELDSPHLQCPPNPHNRENPQVL